MITKIPSFYIFGANTNIGKTIFSTGLLYAACENKFNVHYIKPVQTGYPVDCDASFLKNQIYSLLNKDLVQVTTFAQGTESISPHRLPINEKTLSDDKLLSLLKNEVENTESQYLLIEGAGGVASPTLDGNLQCDFYRNILLPVVFVGDAKLGGISSTISSIEMAQSRGFEISCLLLFEGENENFIFLESYFKNKFPVFSFSNLSSPQSPLAEGNLNSWFKKELNTFKKINEILFQAHKNKFNIVQSSIETAKEHIWWPFTQHKTVSEIKFIDSALNDYISLYSDESTSFNVSSKNNFDGSASWWTQGLGHGFVPLTQAASYAAGRYGHVLFPQKIHEPAAKLAKLLVDGVGKGWAKRVFFSDNGSTAVEVALKMAFRKSFGVQNLNFTPYVLGLKDSYHGDTHAAMDVTNPNVFKGKDHWYKPKGFWLNYPKIFMKNKEYIVQLPSDVTTQKSYSFSSLEDVFSFERKKSSLYSFYTIYIEEQFKIIAEQNIKLGACLLEGVVMGSGGMQWVDPLFQKALIEECKLRNIPVIMDEVFTGFWRLGKISASEMLGIKPDIACYGKLLTGGLLPMSVTLATEEIFNLFLDDKLENALLHGHSYTATPVGCQVSCVALEQIKKSLNFNLNHNELNEIWDTKLVEKISTLREIERVFALGSLFALELKDENSGYCSSKSNEIISYLSSKNIEARPLGNVIYIMAGFNTPNILLSEILNQIMISLKCVNLL